jgi:hypothetical protein
VMTTHAAATPATVSTTSAVARAEPGSPTREPRWGRGAPVMACQLRREVVEPLFELPEVPVPDVPDPVPPN